MSDNNDPATIAAEKIAFLVRFKDDIQAQFNGSSSSPDQADAVRTRINRGMRRAKEIVAETGSMKVVTLAPPAAIGGLIAHDADPFEFILQSFYGMSMTPTVADMIEQAIGVLETPGYLEKLVLANATSDRKAIDAARALTRIVQLCERFPLVARQLQARHGERETLTLNDEYDVQDLFHSLLRIDFDDVRAEEWTPSYAGGSARIDFILKLERIVVETKKTRQSLGAKGLGDELLIDIGRYKAHPDCSTLVCFVYDPEFRIGNPAGLSRDLTGLHDSIQVRVVIAPGNPPAGV